MCEGRVGEKEQNKRMPQTVVVCIVTSLSPMKVYDSMIYVLVSSSAAGNDWEVIGSRTADCKYAQRVHVEGCGLATGRTLALEPAVRDVARSEA